MLGWSVRHLSIERDARCSRLGGFPVGMSRKVSVLENMMTQKQIAIPASKPVKEEMAISDINTLVIVVGCMNSNLVTVHDDILTQGATLGEQPFVDR